MESKLLEEMLLQEMEENSSFRKEVRSELSCINSWITEKKTERKILLYTVGLLVSASAVIIPLIL